MLSWKATDKPNTAIFDQIHYYIEECSVSNKNGDSFDIITNKCYADIIDVKNLNPNQDRFQQLDSRLSYTSFLFKTSPTLTE